MKPRSPRWLLAGAGLLLAAIGRGAAEFPSGVEWHRTSVLPAIAGVLQRLFGGFVSTVGEITAALLVAAALIVLLRSRGRAAGAVGFGVGLALFTFFVSWGLSYRYPPLADRLATLPAARDDAQSAARLIDLGERAARLVRAAAPAVSDFPGDDAALLARINAGLGEGLSRLPASIEAAPVRGVIFGPAKFSRVSFALSRLQLSGFYFPWTGEAQINREMPRSQWPRVAAHEKAHQRGFARENEATVIGILACLASPDPDVFYAGTLGLFVAFDREMARVDREARRRIWKLLPPRAVANFEAEAAFWSLHEGAASAVSEKVNDTYLKAQGVPSGIRSYGETTRLLLQAIETRSLDLGRRLAATSPDPHAE